MEERPSELEKTGKNKSGINIYKERYIPNYKDAFYNN